MKLPASERLAALRAGVVIPAHPLALDARRRLDERHQRALTRYYLAAGAGGIAVGVHTTQFAIREPQHGLLRPVLALAAEEADRYERAGQAGGASGSAGGGASRRPVIRIAGICGQTPQAVSEAALARELGYDIGLLSLSALRHAGIDELIAHARTVGQIIPLMGFYLQPAVGGRVLPYAFWRSFCEIESVIAIKIAPFNRYQTLDVLRGVIDSGRADQIALYTGNDDNILIDLLTPFPAFRSGEARVANQSAARGSGLRIVGGLLGHWAVWTRRAVEHLTLAHEVAAGRRPLDASLLTLAAQITDANAALFDTANGFAGCIAGLHEILYRQGLMATRYCLDPHEDLSPGQREEIDRVCAAYPHLLDDDFVAAHRDEWLR